MVWIYNINIRGKIHPGIYDVPLSQQIKDQRSIFSGERKSQNEIRKKAKFSKMNSFGPIFSELFTKKIEFRVAYKAKTRTFE